MRWGRGCHAERNERSRCARKRVLVVELSKGSVGLRNRRVGSELLLWLPFGNLRWLRLRLESVRLRIEVWHRLESTISFVLETRSSSGSIGEELSRSRSRSSGM